MLVSICRFCRSFLRKLAKLVAVLALLFVVYWFFAGLWGFYKYGDWFYDVMTGHASRDMQMREYVLARTKEGERDFNAYAKRHPKEAEAQIAAENYVLFWMPQAYMEHKGFLMKMRYQDELKLTLHYPTMQPWSLFAEREGVNHIENLSNRYEYGFNRKDFKLELSVEIKKHFSPHIYRKMNSPLTPMESEYKNLNKFFPGAFNQKEYNPWGGVIYVPRDNSHKIDVIECAGENVKGDVLCLVRMHFEEGLQGVYFIPRRLLGNWEEIDREVRAFIDSVIKKRHIINIEKEGHDAYNDVNTSRNEELD